jgi:hypothetical protein
MCAPTIVANRAQARGINHCRQPQRRRGNRVFTDFRDARVEPLKSASARIIIAQRETTGSECVPHSDWATCDTDARQRPLADAKPSNRDFRPHTASKLTDV